MSRKPYNEHDDRTFQDRPFQDRPFQDRIFQESHRGMGRNRKFNQRGGRSNFQPGRQRFRDVDGDVDMNSAGGSGDVRGDARRYAPYKARGQRFQSRQRKDRTRMRKNFGPSTTDPDTQWFKISIPYTKKEGKQFVLRALQSNCKMPFIPFNYQFEGNASVFYVDDFTTARALMDVSKRITLPDGFKMSIFMSKASAPVSNVDNEAIRKIEMCMNNRYDVVTHSLNLKKFHYDPDLRREGLYASLQRPSVLNAILKIIKEHIPEIEKLDVSDNNLFTLQAFSTLVPVCTRLTSLSLENNKLKAMKELDFIKGLNLLNIVLDGNLLCDDFKEKENYINALRARFPKLVILDGCELPAPIGFDLGTVSLPPSKGSYLPPADSVKCLVVSFLEEYYMIYDSDDREKLLEKYHDQALFSLTILKSALKGGKGNGLHIYMNESRNLLRIGDTGHRNKLLKQGRLSVVTALSELPQTQHDPNSFTVDTSLIFPKFIEFSVCGVFKEVANNMVNQPLRTFSRSFIICPHGERWAIVNDMLTIADATPEQVKAFKCPAPTPSPSPAPSTGDKSPNEKQQLLLDFMKFTGMNIDFSTKCLDENDWDYQKAAAVFQELNRVPGTIPPEAFISDERQQLVIELVKQTGMNIEFSAKCLAENDWDFQKASMVFQDLNSHGRIPPEAFVTKPC